MVVIKLFTTTNDARMFNIKDFTNTPQNGEVSSQSNLSAFIRYLSNQIPELNGRKNCDEIIIKLCERSLCQERQLLLPTVTGHCWEI